VLGHVAAGQVSVATSYARTSDQASFPYGECEVVDRVARRVAHTFRWPIEKTESMQVVRYLPGADFSPHYDFFSSTTESGDDALKQMGQRLATLVLYLSAPLRGGSTLFADAEIEVMPVRGNALFFAYPEADASSQTLHAGVPIAEGEKWIGTFFFRERRAFGSPQAQPHEG
jgi:prolyl 4-hydroxylase